MIYVSNIQRFSIHDGPGIRTTVFFKGCNLRCLWCHNPETFYTKPILQFYKQKCTRCGRCTEVCPNDAAIRTEQGISVVRALCVGCGKCTMVCPNDAREINGKSMGIEEILKIVARDKEYYINTGGGLTLSGGEPLLQADACRELLKKAKESGISTAVETALNVSRETLDKVAEYTDFFMCDIKAYDQILHKKLTGCDNLQILDNIKHISSLGKELLIRVPIIPSLNDSRENISETAAFVKSLPYSHKVELLKFHSLARDKYAAMDMEYTVSNITPPTNENMERIKEIFQESGVEALIP